MYKRNYFYFRKLVDNRSPNKEKNMLMRLCVSNQVVQLLQGKDLDCSVFGDCDNV